jgi:CheY-like chemotaxis protein
MRNDGSTLVVLGGHRDDGAKNLREAAASAGAHVEFTETASELAKLVDQLQPLAAIVRRECQSAASACVHVRGQAKLSHVPILGEAHDINDLGFVELFSWGGDDLVSLASPRPLARRLRALTGRDPARPSPERTQRGGYALVIGDGAGFRTLMSRTLFNGGFAVRFAGSAEEAVEESRAEGVKLVVASDSLRPEGAVAALDAARARGSDVPWVIVSPPKRYMATRSAVAAGRGNVAVADAFAPPENVLFVANELLSTRGVDLRSSTRLLYGSTAAFRAAGRDEDETGFSYNVSENGLYVRTLAALEVGQEVWVDLWPPRSERRVRLVGTVAWQRLFGPNEGATVPPGFGVKITGGLGDDLARWRAGYHAFAGALRAGDMGASDDVTLLDARILPRQGARAVSEELQARP